MKRRNELLVGITATIAIVMGVLGALWLARGGLQPGYPLHAKFTWGAGLRQGQPVLLSGVNVGYVDGVDIRPDGFLVVHLRVRRNYQVPLGTTATIEPNGFFGDQMVALHPSRPNPRSYARGDTVLTGRPTPGVGDVLARVDTIAAHLAVLTAALRKELVDTKGFDELRQAIRQATVLMADLSTMAQDQNAELSRTQAALRRVASAVDSAQIDSTVRAMRGAAANATMLATELKTTTANLNAALAKFSEGSGSAAKLMNDPALYDRVVSLSVRLDSLLTDFQKNPRKYIKLSIF